MYTLICNEIKEDKPVLILKSAVVPRVGELLSIQFPSDFKPSLVKVKQVRYSYAIENEVLSIFLDVENQKI